MYALIVLLVFVVVTPAVGVALWPAYQAASVGTSVLTFAGLVWMLRRHTAGAR